MQNVSTKIYMDVQYMPEVTPIHDETILEGESLIINCSADGNPNPQFTWTTPEGRVIDGNILDLNPIQRTQSGNYTCEANNDLYNGQLGIDRETMNVDVQYPPERADIHHPHGGTTTEYKTFVVVCTADSNPKPTFEWFNATDDILSSDSMLKINSTSRDESGIYTCVATTTFHDSSVKNVSSNIYIDVQYIPQITPMPDQTTVEGESLIINCSADGNPNPQFTWTTPEGRVIDGNILELNPVQRTQSGNYTCEANNDLYNGQLGIDRETIIVDVKYLPTIIGNNYFSAEFRQSVTLIVEVQANPIPVTFGNWSKDGLVLPQPINTAMSSSLHIAVVTSEHYGVYNLKCSNDAGTQLFEIHLIQIGPPETPKRLVLEKRSYNYLTIRIIPGYDGGDPGSLVYVFQYRQTGKTDFISRDIDNAAENVIISELMESTDYEMRVYAMNTYGQSRSTQYIVFKTYAKPVLTYNSTTRALHWTGYGDLDNISFCVKIEEYVNRKWMLLESCLSTASNSYNLPALKDVSEEYRIMFCSSEITCEEESFNTQVETMKTKGRPAKDTADDGGLIAGAVIAAVIFVIVSVLAVWCFRRRHSSNEDEEESETFTMEEPDTSRNQQQSNPQAVYESIESVRMDEVNPTGTVTDDNSGYELPEIPKADITVESTIIYETGSYSIVEGRKRHRKSSLVYIKKTKDVSEQNILSTEFNNLYKIGKHENIYDLIGRCEINPGRYCLVFEPFENGNLLDFLKKSTEVFIKSNLQIFARDIANGMAFLASKNIVHCALAAKHVVVTIKNVCKIGELGSAIDLAHNEKHHRRQQDNELVRWKAPETLTADEFTKKSDVWAFSILLYEMATRGMLASSGSEPYNELSSTISEKELLEKLKDGYRLSKPEGCCIELYTLMKDCWKANAKDRLDFTVIVKRCKKLGSSYQPLEGRKTAKYEVYINTQNEMSATGEYELMELNCLNNLKGNIKHYINNIS
ncbi:inactive tyrosine-protein kinase 7-like [Glandiceps talaboti]